MSPLRSASRRFSVASALLFTALGAACSDASSVIAPSDAFDAPAAIITSDLSTTSATRTSGDTTVTVFVVDAGTIGNVELGNHAKILFPYGSGSICSLVTSSYGPTTWNSACTPSALPVMITAKTWTNAQGQVEVDFQPAMRFVPGLKKSVELSLKTANLSVHIDFRQADGTLVNEALTDASLKTSVNARTGYATRIIKHFSGYTVTAD